MLFPARIETKSNLKVKDYIMPAGLDTPQLARGYSTTENGINYEHTT
jgi:hypothetical protein